MGFIYKVTNKVNGKSYIGQTIREPKIRWQEHQKRDINKDTYFHRALKKYGIDNFTWEIIEECNNSVLNEREIYWIKKFDTFYKNEKGYNMTIGGSQVSDKRKAIIAISPLQEEYLFPSITDAETTLSHLFNKNFSHISCVCSGARKSHHGWVFYYLDENGDRIIPNYSGDRPRKNRTVVATNLKTQEQTIFSSAADASRKLNIGKTNISKCLRGIWTNTKGYKFEYLEERKSNNENN